MKTNIKEKKLWKNKNNYPLSCIEVGCSLGPSGTVRVSSRNPKLYALIWNQPDQIYVISGDQINFWCCVLFLNNSFLAIFYIFYFTFASISLTACPVMAKTWLSYTLKASRFLVVVLSKNYLNFLNNFFFHLAKLIEHWHLRPKGALRMGMRRSPRICLSTWCRCMTTLSFGSENTKNKNLTRDLEGARWSRVAQKAIRKG